MFGHYPALRRSAMSRKLSYDRVIFGSAMLILVLGLVMI